MNKKLIKQAQEFLLQGDLDQALTVFQQLLSEEPNNADFLHQIGIIYAQKHDYAQALEYINQAIKQQPQLAAIHNSKGNILLRQGRLDEALAEYQKTVKLESRYAIGYNNIGRCLYLQEKLVAAKKAYAKAIELNPQFKDAFYNQGVLLVKLGELEAAQNSLEKALELNSKNPAIYGQLAQIYLQKGQYSEAINYLQKRLLAQPEHVDSWHQLGIAHLALDQFEDAAHSFEKILQLTHQHPECYEHLAIAYLKLDDKEKALTYFLRQLEVQATANAFYNIGVLLLEKGRQKDAIEYLNQALKLEPLHLPAHLNLGVIYLKNQQLKSALVHYQKAAAIKPNDPEIEHILMALTQNKVPDKAPAEYLQNLFDQYASYYDKHLTESLRYRVPQQMHSAIYQLVKTDTPSWTILDLGCGTGLSGELFKEFSSRLIGIDISQEMVTAAKTKNIYDELQIGDIEQYIANYSNIDLVIAADVFTYIGELDQIFAKVNQVLKPLGLFSFSVEKTEKPPFELLPTIRYAHSRAYLETLAEKHGFMILKFSEIILRMQKDSPVYGYLVVLKKP